jgi:hypothetical protein
MRLVQLQLGQIGLAQRDGAQQDARRRVRRVCLAAELGREVLVHGRDQRGIPSAINPSQANVELFGRLSESKVNDVGGVTVGQDNDHASLSV